MNKYTRRFELVFTSEEFDRLKTLADQRKVSMAEVIRKALKREYEEACPTTS